jgi:hypothetical protein
VRSQFGMNVLNLPSNVSMRNISMNPETKVDADWVIWRMIFIYQGKKKGFQYTPAEREI